MFSRESQTRVLGDLALQYYFGDEQTFVDTGNGLQRLSSDKRFSHWDVNLDGEHLWNLGRLQILLRDRFTGDIYSDKNQISRNSDYQNLAELESSYFLSETVRMRGKLSYDVFEDQSFPEFSTDDFGGVLEWEKLIRRNTFLSVGYEAHDVDFEFSPLDNYYQQDAYLKFFRYSPVRMTIKALHRPPEKLDSLMMDKETFQDGTRDLLIRNGHGAVAARIPEYSLKEARTEFLPYQVDSPMTFELETRVRQRELYNTLERSFLEGQVNGLVLFQLSPSHTFSIENNFSDRDYARQNLTDNVLSYQRNEGEISHFIFFNRIMMDHRFEIDSVFYKDQPDFDYVDWTFSSNVSYDVLRNWNVSAYNAWKRVEYDVPRQFFTNNDYNVHSLSTQWKFSSKVSAKFILDYERRTFKFFTNVIDSSFSKKGRDFRVNWDLRRNFGFHTGYKWERERHASFQVNDRYEDLFYVGSSMKL